MSKIVFMVEEESMKTALDGLLPMLMPNEIPWQVIPHEGKSDLEKSLPIKLKGWREPDVRFVVLRDNDGGDCVAIKQKLVEICLAGHRSDTLVRIVCQELEAWFLGDLAAVSRAFNKPAVANLQRKKKFRTPDNLGSPYQELKKLIPNYQKVSGARKIAPHLDLATNRSKSFQVFISGITKVLSSNQ